MKTETFSVIFLPVTLIMIGICHWYHFFLICVDVFDHWKMFNYIYYEFQIHRAYILMFIKINNFITILQKLFLLMKLAIKRE